jgi:hypothetical protein
MWNKFTVFTRITRFTVVNLQFLRQITRFTVVNLQFLRQITRFTVVNLQFLRQITRFTVVNLQFLRAENLKIDKICKSNYSFLLRGISMAPQQSAQRQKE